MPHVDEGLIHEYIDGELEDVASREIEAHLAECEACTATLSEARVLVDQTRSILGRAAPDVATPVALPASKRNPRRRTIPLAWAASLTLAVTAGWLANDIIRQGAADAPTPLEPTSIVAENETGTRDSVGRDDGSQRRPQPPDRDEPALAPASTPETALDEVAVAAPRRQEMAKTESVAEPEPRREADRAFADAAGAAAERRLSGERPAPMDALASIAQPGVRGDDAMSIDTLPGFVVTAVEGSGAAFVVTQLSASGDTVRVTYTLESQLAQNRARASVLDRLEEQAASVSGMVRGYVVTIAGSLSADSLAVLLRIIEARDP